LFISIEQLQLFFESSLCLTSIKCDCCI